MTCRVLPNAAQTSCTRRGGAQNPSRSDRIDFPNVTIRPTAAPLARRAAA